MCIRGFIGPSRTLSVLSTLGDCAGAEAFLAFLPFVVPLRTLIDDRFFGMRVSSLISIWARRGVGVKGEIVAISQGTYPVVKLAITAIL